MDREEVEDEGYDAMDIVMLKESKRKDSDALTVEKKDS